MGDEAALDAAIETLYGLAPEDFLARRTALAAAAKSAKDTELAKAIGALRKPSVAAWAVNLLARERDDLMDELVELAARLRAAQERLDGPALVELGRERSTLVDRLVAATVDVVAAAGGKLTSAAAQTAGTTFVAALADPGATAAVTSGRLTRALEYAGFGDVDLHEATARPLRLVRPDERAPAAAVDDLDAATTDERPQPAESAEPADHSEPTRPPDTSQPGQEPDPVAAASAAALAAAEKALQAAMATATTATSRHGVLTAQLELAETRVGQLQAELSRARAHRDQTADALAEADLTQAAAQRELRRARAAVEDLRGS